MIAHESSNVISNNKKNTKYSVAKLEPFPLYAPGLTTNLLLYSTLIVVQCEHHSIVNPFTKIIGLRLFSVYVVEPEHVNGQ